MLDQPNRLPQVIARKLQHRRKVTVLLRGNCFRRGLVGNDQFQVSGFGWCFACQLLRVL